MLIFLRALQFRQFLLVPEVAMAIVCQQNQSRAARLTALSCQKWPTSMQQRHAVLEPLRQVGAAPLAVNRSKTSQF